MATIENLDRRVTKLTDQMGVQSSGITPCLVPPPDMPLFTVDEQYVLQELERKIVPFIPTGPGSLIQEDGGPYFALFAIRLDVFMALKRMGALEGVWQALTSHERWILPRWWTVYKGLKAPGSPELEARRRRHILRTREELLERFLSIDFDHCPSASYPFTSIGYGYLKRHLEDETRRFTDWDALEQWYDFAEEHQL